MHPPENGGDPSRQVGQVNLSAAADRPSILLAVILGAATLIIMIAVLVLILTNVFRTA